MVRPLATLITEDRIHVAYKVDGQSRIATFVRDPELDNDLSPEEMAEWVRVNKACGVRVEREVAS